MEYKTIPPSKIDQQNKFIMAKYNFSKDIYKNKYTNESIYVFLNDFDDMNVYSMYPEMIVLDFDDEIEHIQSESKIYDEIDEKLREFKKFNENKGEIAEYIRGYKKTGKKLGRVRKYFSYEVIDYAANVLNIYPVTNAWLKCYEIITYFEMIPKDKKKFNSFHICELPGTFILAINHYIKTKTNVEEFNWNAQSLNPRVVKEKGKFLPDQYGMAKKHHDRYHWGIDETGDITNVNNISFYSSQFNELDLVTSDCGQDSSKDFTKQETKLNRVMWSQFVCACLMLRKGGNYIAKIFTINTKKMIDMVHLCTTAFEKTYLVKPLKTKPTSGERYLVCLNYKKNIDVSKLMDYLKDFDKRDTFLGSDVNKNFIKKLAYANKIMGCRRITSINQSIYQVNNFRYINEHPNIYEHNKKMVDYYVNYFMRYYKLEKIKDGDKII